VKYYGTSNGTDYGFSPSKSVFTSYVEIEESEYKSLFDGQSNGKQIKHDESGKPYLADYDTTPSKEQQIATLQREIEELEKKQYRSMKAIATKTATKDDEEYFTAIEEQILKAREKISELRLT
jgi:cold shock CspA family protein